MTVNSTNNSLMSGPGLNQLTGRQTYPLAPAPVSAAYGGKRARKNRSTKRRARKSRKSRKSRRSRK